MIEKESGLQMCEVMARGTGGAPFVEPRLACGVVAFEQVDRVWVDPGGSRFEVVEMTTHHGDELGGVLEAVDADERGIVASCEMSQGPELDGGGPLEVPPELGFGAVATSRRKTGVTAGGARGHTWNQERDRARRGALACGERGLDEAEVATQVGADEMEFP